MNRTYQLTNDDILNIVQQVNDGCKWQEVLASIQTKEAPLATALDLSDRWNKVYADCLKDHQGPSAAVRIANESCAALQPPSGQVGEFRGWVRYIDNGKRVAFQTFKSPDDGDDWVPVFEALRQPVETVDIDDLAGKMEECIAFDDDGSFCGFNHKQAENVLRNALRTQPQAPVDTRIPERLRGDPWVLQLMDWVDGKAPMVEVPTVEEIEQVLMSTLRPRVLINATGNKIRPKNVKMETNSAEVAQAIHALLQSKGGR